MNQNETAIKIAEEIILSKKVIFRKEDLLVFLERAYAVGFDEGRKQTAHGKPVVQLNIQGERLAEYLNMNDAAKKMNLTKSSISKAVLGTTQTAGGFYWKLK